MRPLVVTSSLADGLGYRQDVVGPCAPSTLVVVPYTVLHPEVLRALGRCWLVDTSSDDYAYWRLVRSLWRRRLDFVIVEHDIVVGRDTLASFDACPESWCSFGYPIRGGAIMDTFGCVRFRADLLHEQADLFEHPALAEPVHWAQLDSTVGHVLIDRLGHVRHRHEGLLRHIGV